MKTFTAVALLLGIVAMTTSAPTDVEQSEAPSPCHVRGKQYRSGTIFSLLGQECIEYKCNDGSVAIISDGCKDNDGVCHAVNSTWNYSTCVTLKCSRQEKDGDLYYRYYADKMGCEDDDNQCHDVNTTWVKKCLTFKCTLEVNQTTGMNTLRTTIDSMKCEDMYGTCHTEDEKFTQKIRDKTYTDCRCEISSTRIRYKC